MAEINGGVSVGIAVSPVSIILPTYAENGTCRLLLLLLY
jgi:hypothetical protein